MNVWADAKGIFRSDLSLNGFCRLFNLNSPEIVANQRRRWRAGLMAAANGRLLDRGSVRPAWRPRRKYWPPIPGRLQSSYEDVEAELRKISQELGGVFFFVAGDGLSLMRMNHILKSQSDRYLDFCPCIIPIQGENTAH